MKPESKKDKKNIKEGDLVSVPFGNKYLQGTVESMNEQNLTIKNYANGKVEIPNNDLVYKFFPGQKFDLRELNSIDAGADGTSVRQKLDHFLAKTSVGSFDSLMKNDPKEVGKLLAGRLTDKLFKGASLVNDGESDVKVMKDWAAKFQLYRGRDKNIKLDVKFQRPELDLKVYGQPVTEAEKKAMLEKEQTVILDRKSNAGKDFKVFAKHDKDLNSIITFPYSEKIEERIKKANTKKESQSQTKKETASQVKSNGTNPQGEAPKPPKKNKGKGI